uniref:Leucine-rich repeat-containing protein 14-like n=1 Tax=Cyanistes caeruleus TaxID=156563 RepID=A0A8C0UZX1_CYACU
RADAEVELPYGLGASGGCGWAPRRIHGFPPFPLRPPHRRPPPSSLPSRRSLSRPFPSGITGWKTPGPAGFGGRLAFPGAQLPAAGGAPGAAPGSSLQALRPGRHPGRGGAAPAGAGRARPRFQPEGVGYDRTPRFRVRPRSGRDERLVRHRGFGQGLRGGFQAPAGIPEARIQAAQRPIRSRHGRGRSAAPGRRRPRRPVRQRNVLRDPARRAPDRSRRPAAPQVPRIPSGGTLGLAGIVSLLESLHPSRVRRVDLRFNNLGLTGLSVILPHLSRFPELRSLKLQYSNVDVRRPTPESAIGIRCLAGQLGMLPSLRELNLGSSRLSGNLRQILCDLQAPLESLELAFCSLVPADLAFLSQSFHAPALKRLDLSGHDFSQGLLEPLRLLLEETSASLLHLDLMECRMADSHLDALLPTLRRCSRLRFLGLYGNSLSTAALKDLLQKTLELPDLHLVVYPFPVDCYKPEPPRRVPGSRRIYEEPMDGERLAAATAEISQLLANSGRTDLVWTYNPYGHGALDYFSL